MKNRMYLVFAVAMVLSAETLAADYVGIGLYQATQNIGVQGMNDNALDYTCRVSTCLTRGMPDGSSPTQSTNVSEVFIGWNRKPLAFEVGISDLGTYRVEDQATTADDKLFIRSNITMTAVHGSVLGYMGRFFARIGGHINHTSVQSALHSSQPPVNYSLSGTKAGVLYGLGADFGNFRAEVKRFAHVGVMDVTGQTDVGVVGISYRMQF